MIYKDIVSHYSPFHSIINQITIRHMKIGTEFNYLVIPFMGMFQEFHFHQW